MKFFVFVALLVVATVFIILAPVLAASVWAILQIFGLCALAAIVGITLVKGKSKK